MNVDSFHSSRRMFWILDSRLIVAPVGTKQTHIEFAREQGLLGDLKADVFMAKHTRGFYLAIVNPPVVHFYTRDFDFDDSTIKVVKKVLPELAKTLQMPKATQVFLGPKDSVINGRKYVVNKLGVVGCIVKK